MTKKEKKEEFKEVEKAEEDEEEISDEEFEQFIQQNMQQNRGGFSERSAPVLDSSDNVQENLEESLGDVETKSEESGRNIDYSFNRSYGDVYTAKNYETEIYSAKTYGDLSETRKFDLGRGLIENTMRNDERNVDLGRLNMQQQQMSPMMNQQQEDNRRYLEIKQAQALEERNIPFENTLRKKERVLK